jgi:hypothetical protein
MNKRAQTKWRVAGLLEASPDAVWEKLLDTFPMLSPQARSELARESSPDVFKLTTGEQGAGRITIEVEKRQHQVALQGEWWYRGVYSLQPHARGSLLIHQVYNIAPGAGWWAAQLVQGPAHARKMEEQFQSLLNTIGNQLSCVVELQRAAS